MCRNVHWSTSRKLHASCGSGGRLFRFALSETCALATPPVEQGLEIGGLCWLPDSLSRFRDLDLTTERLVLCNELIEL